MKKRDFSVKSAHSRVEVSTSHGNPGKNCIYGTVGPISIWFSAFFPSFQMRKYLPAVIKVQPLLYWGDFQNSSWWRHNTTMAIEWHQCLHASQHTLGTLNTHSEHQMISTRNNGVCSLVFDLLILFSALFSLKMSAISGKNWKTSIFWSQIFKIFCKNSKKAAYFTYYSLWVPYLPKKVFIFSRKFKNFAFISQIVKTFCKNSKKSSILYLLFSFSALSS